VELVAAVRFTLRQMQPHIYDGSKVDEAGNKIDEAQVSPDEAQLLNRRMATLLHGGRFNWEAYFKEGAKGVIDRKRVKRTKEEKAKFEENSLRIGKCVESWGKESPAVEFIYDYLCDLVHPNKGSNWHRDDHGRTAPDGNERDACSMRHNNLLVRDSDRPHDRMVTLGVVDL
jgi:hypothetical protein